MIIVKLKGGLGNQMFQYAAARCLSVLRNTTLKLDTSFLLDRSPLKDFTYRNFELHIFNIPLNFANDNDLKRFLDVPDAGKIWERLKQSMNPLTIYRQSQFHFDPAFFLLSKNSLLDGSFQSEKYFLTVEKLIHDDFQFNYEPIEITNCYLKSIINETSVAVHFRRGDYISNEKTFRFHGICSFDYYRKAMEYIVLNVENPVFYIFSDDIDWVNQNFETNHKVRFVSTSKPSEDLRLMSKCKHQIIANSSFSWWAAWLNQNSGKYVIAPKKWFNESTFNTEDLLPNKWIRI